METPTTPNTPSSTSEPPPPPLNPPPTPLPSTEPPPPASSTPNPPKPQEQEPEPKPKQTPPPPAVATPRPRTPAPNAPVTQRVGPTALSFAPHNQRAPPPSNPNPFSSLRPSYPFSAPSPSFPQPFGAALHHRSSSAGGPDMSASSGQVRQPVPSVQKIGMIGSLSTAPAASPIRSITSQMRLGDRQSPQPQVRSAPPSANQTKFPTNGIPRGPSITDTTSQSPAISRGPSVTATASQSPAISRGPSVTATTFQPPAPANLPSFQQQRTSNQVKQMSSVPSTPFRPPMKQPMMQQRPQYFQQQQQQLQQQQLQLQKLPQNQSQALQASRAHVLTISNPTAQVPGQLGSRALVPSNGDDEPSKEIISRKRIHELLAQVDQSEQLRPEIEDDLVEISEDFVESIVTAACQLAKHRKSTMLEAKDILLHVERHWHMTLPGFTGDEIKCYKKQPTIDVHRERLALMAGAQNGIANGAQNGSDPADTAATPPQPTAVERAISRLFRDLAAYRWNQGHMEDRLENCGHTLIAANRQMAKLKRSRKRLSRKLTLLRHQHGERMAQLELRIVNLQSRVTQQQTQLEQLTTTEHSATGGHHVRDMCDLAL